MDNLFYKNDLDDVNELKINLDDLYEQKRVSDLAKLNIYNKLLKIAKQTLENRNNVDKLGKTLKTVEKC